MNYRRLGRSGLKVSDISLGSWLTFGHSVSQDVTNACVRKAFDLGINFIDTADVYALGACETALGSALRGVPRRNYVLATKVFFPTGQGINDRGLSRKHMRESLDASLARLGTEYVDLYQCHRFDPETPLEELVRTMDDFIRQGRILYWGVSMWSAAALADVVRIALDMNAAPPISNQPNYNLLEREIEAEVIPMSENVGVSQVVYSPLAQGLLTGKYRGDRAPRGSRAFDESSNQFIKARMTDANFAKIERLAAVADKIGMPLGRLALAWCLRSQNVASTIVGVTRPEQLVENAAASGVSLDQSTIAAIEGALRG